jgi:GxxExxY protein
MNQNPIEEASGPRSGLSGLVIGAAIEVHRALGPGLLESAYATCLARELELQGVPFEREVALPLWFKGARLDCGYRLDLVVADCIIVEVKAVESLTPLHTAQLLTYLRLSKRPLGLLFNFKVSVLKSGIRRVINSF